MTFESDEARRQYFLAQLKEKLPELRQRPDFPVAADEVFFDEALDKATRRTRSTFPCPHCAVKLTKDNLVRSFETLADPASGRPWKRIRLRPVLISYSVGEARYEKEPDAADLGVLDRVAGLPLPSERRLKLFRLEAVRAGFRRAWQARDYATIVDVAGKIPEDVLQEDPKLLIWYDQALTKSGTD